MTSKPSEGAAIAARSSLASKKRLVNSLRTAVAIWSLNYWLKSTSTSIKSETGPAEREQRRQGRGRPERRRKGGTEDVAVAGIQYFIPSLPVYSLIWAFSASIPCPSIISLFTFRSTLFLLLSFLLSLHHRNTSRYRHWIGWLPRSHSRTDLVELVLAENPLHEKIREKRTNWEIKETTKWLHSRVI